MTRKYPIGIQSFRKIREEGYIYVDKTRYIWQLLEEGQYFFLSRPRRFGKSLLVSTIEALFQGHRELFDGLYIDSVDYDWKQYPVLHLDLNSQDYTQDNALYEALDLQLSQWEARFGLAKSDRSPASRFRLVIEAAYRTTGCQVVVLIDEYDKPLLANMFDKERSDRFRETLKAFYGVLKSCDRFIRFGFLTGVTKFGKVSVFSDLNNLRDISLLPSYNGICGVTESELADVFDYDIGQLAVARGSDREQTMSLLREYYDGYHFSEPIAEGIYNPFSILNVFINLRFSYYWFQTGTPSMLVELLKRTETDLTILEGVERSEEDLMGMEPAFRDPVPVLFQSGYLTIKSYNERRKRYRLGFPNEEVTTGFLEALLPAFVSKSTSKDDADIFLLLDALEDGDVDLFMQILQSFMAGIPYSNESARIPERRFSDIIFIVSSLLGTHVEAEHATNRGRIDLLFKTERYIYIIEFKIDDTPSSALEQIERLGYALPFLTDGRAIITVGAEFSSSSRNITDWETVEIDSKSGAYNRIR